MEDNSLTMKRLMIKKTQSQYSVCDHKTKAKPVNATFKCNTARKEVKKTPIVSEYSSTAQLLQTYKSDTKRINSTTNNIEAKEPSSKKRSITLEKIDQEELEIAAPIKIDDDEDEFNHDEECDENLGDTRNKERQSISELITLHKLFTSKPQVPKFVNRITPKIENEIISLSSNKDEESGSDTESEESPERKPKVENECDVFYWCDEFDEILNGTHSEVFYNCIPFTEVKRCKSCINKLNYQESFDILSTFMSIKADCIRNSKSKMAKSQNLFREKSNQIVKKNIENEKNIQKNSPKNKRKLNKANSMKNETFKSLEENLVFNSNCEIEDIKDYYNNNQIAQSMIGWIDKYGIYSIDLDSAGLELQSYLITDDAGFFDKIIIESNYKAWISNMKHTFEIFQKLYTKFKINSRLSALLLGDKIESFRNVDAFNEYFTKVEITCFNNPIVANQ